MDSAAIEQSGAFTAENCPRHNNHPSGESIDIFVSVSGFAERGRFRLNKQITLLLISTKTVISRPIYCSTDTWTLRHDPPPPPPPLELSSVDLCCVGGGIPTFSTAIISTLKFICIKFQELLVSRAHRLSSSRHDKSF